MANTKGGVRSMDRREALKKMAVGGATVAGATAVMSSPAFAYSQPFDVVPNVSITFPYGLNNSNQWANKIRVRVKPSGKCPASSTNPSLDATLESLSVNISFTTADNAILTFHPNQGQTGGYVSPIPSPAIPNARNPGPLAPGPLNQNDSDIYAMRLTKIQPGTVHTSPLLPILTGDRLNLSITAQLKCTYTSGSRTRDVSWNQSWRRAGGGTNQNWQLA